jgi:hypothetical protein
MGLIKTSDLEAKLGRSLTADEADAFTIINEANQNYVEKVIIGSSVESVTATTRYYDGGLQHLVIDPCTDLTALKIVDDDQIVTDTFDTSDYTVESVNRTLKTMIRYRNGQMPRGIRNIAVTAKFSTYGDSEITAIIKDALISALESEVNNTDNIKREAIEGYSVEFAQSQTKDSLKRLKGLFPNIL